MKKAWMIVAAFVAISTSVALAADASTAATATPADDTKAQVAAKDDAAPAAQADATPAKAATEPVLIASGVRPPSINTPDCPTSSCPHNCQSGSCTATGSTTDNDTGLTECVLPNGSGISCLNGKTIHEIGKLCVSNGCTHILCAGNGTVGYVCE